MSQSCSREQIRELDRRAIEDVGIPGIVLMENAGRGAADVAADMLGNPAKKQVIIFCGKGNNGGDGYVIARHLYNRGARIHLVLACPVMEIHPETDAGANLSIARQMGLHPLVADTSEKQIQAAALAKRGDLLVDALFGTGLTGEVRPPYYSLIRILNAEDKPILAVDIPSGIDADTGNVLRAAVRATRTATFVMPKHGFALNEGPHHTGEVTIVDIGVPLDLIEEVCTG